MNGVPGLDRHEREEAAFVSMLERLAENPIRIIDWEGLPEEPDNPIYATCELCGYVERDIPVQADEAHGELCCGIGWVAAAECFFMKDDGHPCVGHVESPEGRYRPTALGTVR